MTTTKDLIKATVTYKQLISDLKFAKSDLINISSDMEEVMEVSGENAVTRYLEWQLMGVVRKGVTYDASKFVLDILGADHGSLVEAFTEALSRSKTEYEYALSCVIEADSMTKNQTNSAKLSYYKKIIELLETDLSKMTVQQ